MEQAPAISLCVGLFANIVLGGICAFFGAVWRMKSSYSLPTAALTVVGLLLAVWLASLARESGAGWAWSIFAGLGSFTVYTWGRPEFYLRSIPASLVYLYNYIRWRRQT